MSRLRKRYVRVVEQLRSDLATVTREGAAYRVDLRLRPYGRSGPLVSPMLSLERYYRCDAELWEIQSLLKARPVAGDRDLGEDLLRKLKPLLTARRDPKSVWRSITTIRGKAVRKTSARRLGTVNVKESPGGIRDIEFLLQALQLINAHRRPEILCGNTLKSIRILQLNDILDDGAARQLRIDYLFLRRVEHHLQILEDQQVHTLPADSVEFNTLAKRILGTGCSSGDLTDSILSTMKRVTRIAERFSEGA